MPRARSPQTTPLSDWLDRNIRIITREGLAHELGILRENLDRLCRGARRPGLDLAFEIEDVTRRVTEGWDILLARTWQRRRRLVEQL